MDPCTKATASNIGKTILKGPKLLVCRGPTPPHLGVTLTLPLGPQLGCLATLMLDLMITVA